MSLIYQCKELVGGSRPGLYIGGKKDAKNLEKLRQWNITHILNMTPEKDVNVKAGVPNYFEKKVDIVPAFQYKRIAVYDSPTGASGILDAAEEIISFISKGLLHGSVLVHCQQGVSRSTTAAAIYLIKRASMTAKEALALITRRRPEACPIPAFVELLESFEKQCCPESAVKRELLGPAPPPKRRQLIGPQPPTSTIDPNAKATKDE
ncbi:dual specificity MAP kinase phosphatase [Fistulifera solaris]|uniref:protein-tyrosine-phosphatase n=1 Tax=Fistulifera solaris TaxID=1519565 RepID=A0A1Z5J9K7_FISSO|nr:dual specificity MAP kinase phosphatase [Fistulifera solaris]|eukprot:GAX10649.1 dual specificity MAP kinase phosphatase [Fistulifera solaris]